MALLLDTHILLWALETPERLPETVREMLISRDQEVYFSAVSIWEIAVKSALKRFAFRYSPDEIVDGARQTGFIELPVTAAHGARVADLPLHHNDPFDRLLIAQTLSLPARFITADTILGRYSDLVQLLR